jgi:hypothetical protein
MEGYATLRNDKMIQYILNLIRYDIPILLTGSSSIGKSYTILGIASQYNIPHQILYVGSEKADNIEGLPKLTGLSSEDDKLSYLKPYWFPDSDMIKTKVSNGKLIFENINSVCFNKGFKFNYPALSGLLNDLSKISYEGNSLTTEGTIDGKKFKFSREGVNSKYGVNELQDVCLFITTILGFGNYWLVLDELDKVDEIDADKYAPMLHIVRERILKDYNLVEINGGKGVNAAKVEGDDYFPIYAKLVEDIEKENNILDTRIIAISNQTENINEISEALFRRFVQIIVTDVLILKKVDEETDFIKQCLAKKQTEKYVKDVPIAYLDEINLQWLYGFLPKILNTGDGGNFIREDFIKALSDSNQSVDSIPEEKVFSDTFGTAFYKLLYDNFRYQEALRKNLTDCAYQRLTGMVNQKKNNEYFKGGVANDELREISEKKKLSFDSKLIADDIDEAFNKEWVNVILKQDDKSRINELDSIIRRYFEYIKSGCGIGDSIDLNLLKENSYPDLPYYLIPKWIRFAFKITVNDETISGDDVVIIQDTVSILMKQLSKSIRDSVEIQHWLEGYLETTVLGEKVKLKVDYDEASKMMYAPKNSFLGGVSGNSYNIEAFKNSFVYAYYDRVSTFERIKYITEIINGARATNKYSQPIINFICLFYEKEIKDYFQENIKAMLGARKMEEFRTYTSIKGKFVELCKKVKEELKD